MKKEILEYLGKQDLVQVQVVTEPRKGKAKFSDKAILREIAKNEIVIEFDTDSKRKVTRYFKKTIKKLRYHNYNFFVYSHKGRSPHIHIYNINGLEEQEQPVISQYKRLFLKKYANFKETDVGINTACSHLIAVEFKPHFKHGNIKELIYASKEIDNRLELPLIQQANDTIKRYEDKKDYNRGLDNKWFLEWIVKENLPIGKWNNVIAKNLAILIRTQNLNEEEVLKRFERKDAKLIKGWMKWVDEGHTEFGFWEIFNFGDEYGINISDKMKQYR